MTISSGVGGTLAAGAIIGSADIGAKQTPVTAASGVANQLAFTGASHVTLEVIVALVAIMAGFLMLGFCRRYDRGRHLRPGHS